MSLFFVLCQVKFRIPYHAGNERIGCARLKENGHPLRRRMGPWNNLLPAPGHTKFKLTRTLSSTPERRKKETNHLWLLLQDVRHCAL